MIDYPQLNFIFGLVLIFTLMVGIGLRVLLSKLDLPVWMSVLSWVAQSEELLAIEQADDRICQTDFDFLMSRRQRIS